MPKPNAFTKPKPYAYSHTHPITATVTNPDAKPKYVPISLAHAHAAGTFAHPIITITYPSERRPTDLIVDPALD